MNGANAEPSVKTINAPNNTKMMTMGASHHFFRTFMNSQNSRMIESLPIVFSLFCLIKYHFFKIVFHNQTYQSAKQVPLSSKTPGFS